MAPVVHVCLNLHITWNIVSQASPIPFLRVPILKAIGAAERNGAGSRDYVEYQLEVVILYLSFRTALQSLPVLSGTICNHMILNLKTILLSSTWNGNSVCDSDYFMYVLIEKCLQ